MGPMSNGDFGALGADGATPVCCCCWRLERYPSPTVSKTASPSVSSIAAFHDDVSAIGIVIMLFRERLCIFAQAPGKACIITLFPQTLAGRKVSATIVSIA